jgi:hypothetical protein
MDFSLISIMSCRSDVSAERVHPTISCQQRLFGCDSRKDARIRGRSKSFMKYPGWGHHPRWRLVGKVMVGPLCKYRIDIFFLLYAPCPCSMLYARIAWSDHRPFLTLCAMRFAIISWPDPICIFYFITVEFYEELLAHYYP